MRHPGVILYNHSSPKPELPLMYQNLHSPDLGWHSFLCCSYIYYSLKTKTHVTLDTDFPHHSPGRGCAWFLRDCGGRRLDCQNIVFYLYRPFPSIADRQRTLERVGHAIAKTICARGSTSHCGNDCNGFIFATSLRPASQ